MTRGLIVAALSAGLALLAACGTNETPSEPADAVASTEPAAESTDATDATAPAETPLDYSALSEREAPDKLLAFYAEALHRRQWSAAALAWDSNAGISAELLQGAYDKAEPPTLAIGKGTDEGAAGSLFYEAPVVLDFGDGGETLRGTITLRRVNDVPGAGEEQLSWRVKSSTIGPDR
ncbi:MAG: hypothetical protein H6917_05370 [Novosphingobium sp.]|nr:hypothetical protein [Novosphingobium sp.]MCP5401801.1 hypothetical protein [Novosphingobium sp.]